MDPLSIWRNGFLVERADRPRGWLLMLIAYLIVESCHLKKLVGSSVASHFASISFSFVICVWYLGIHDDLSLHRFSPLLDLYLLVGSASLLDFQKHFSLQTIHS